MANFKVQLRSKKKNKTGDVFVYTFDKISFYYGAVANHSIKLWDCRLNLIYLYSYKSDDLTKEPELNKQNLILPPVIVNNTPWLDGFFQNVLHVADLDIFPRHCFFDPARRLHYDDDGKLVDKFEPCGLRAISSAISLDDEISEVLDQEK